MSTTFLTAGRFDLRAIMSRAVEIARLGALDAAWSRKMVAGLRFAWSMAKAEMVRHRIATGKQKAPKMRLERRSILELIARMQDKACNTGRDLMDGLHRFSGYGELLERARSEYRLIPVAERSLLLVDLHPETGGRPIRHASTYGWSTGR